MIVIDEEYHECQVIEEIEKYLDLARELTKVWNMKVTVVPLEVGSLGTPAKALEKKLKTIGTETKIY